jgi:hypothetical protein
VITGKLLKQKRAVQLHRPLCDHADLSTVMI